MCISANTQNQNLLVDSLLSWSPILKVNNYHFLNATPFKTCYLNIAECILHKQKACHCKPFNILLQYDGITSFGESIYQGSQAESKYPLDEPTKAILHNMHNKLPPTIQTAHPLDYNLLMNGIKKWPKWMSMSSLASILM